jgi:ABC-type molybdenum transport system ATPase subunit/photorepair protein PhrA
MSFSVMDGAYTAPVDQSLFILPSQSKRGGTISNGQVKSMYLIRAAVSIWPPLLILDPPF